MEIPNIGKGVAKQLVIADFDTPLKVIQMTKEDFLTLDGFKEKKQIRFIMRFKTQSTQIH